MNEHRFSEQLSASQAVADKVAANGHLPSPSGRGARAEGPEASRNGTPGAKGAATAPNGERPPETGPTRRADASTLANDARKPADGRDENGRFAKGNPGGPGNPFAREVARMRQAFRNRVSIKDLEDIADRMLALAKEGNVQAAKFICSYMIGKPLPGRDPDHLNEHEAELLKTEATFTEMMGPIVNKPEPEVPLLLMRTMREEMTRRANATIAAGMYYSLPPEGRKAYQLTPEGLKQWTDLNLVPPSANARFKKKHKRR